MRNVAVVGAGWAGLAAAVEATRAGHRVTLFEAARIPGGRARTLEVALADGRAALLDNGQHILVGAYLRTLALMESVGVAPDAVLLRLPLVLRFPEGGGLALPDWRAPWDAAAGILGARGWTLHDKVSLLRASAGWRLAGFTCAPGTTVAQLTAGLTLRVRAELVDPLCVAALNTPPAQACGQVFLRVLRDALFERGHGEWGGSNLLLPRQALGQVFPEAALAWLQSQGARLRVGQRVQGLARAGTAWEIDGARFDAVVLAAPPWEAARLVAACGAPAAGWLSEVRALAYEPIATVYAMGGPRLPLPMLALRSSDAHPAQFVFDRAQLGGPEGLLAFVVSASRSERDALQAQVLAQAAALGWRLQPVQTVVEKRATFACVPGLKRPAPDVAPGLWACGDYVRGPYPATLEGAVRSALQAVAQLTETARTTP